MALPMRSTEFRATVAPILNKTFDGIWDQRSDEWKQTHKEEQGIERAYHEVPVLFGFNAAPEMPDGTPVDYQSGGTLFIKRYVYKVYGSAFALTKVLVEDGDHISIGKIYAEHLAQALIETKETKAANDWNFSFNDSYPGGDGVALISTSHPVVSGVQSNRLTTAAAMSQTSVEQMLIQIMNATDANGKHIRLKPRHIVTGPSGSMQGEVIVKSVLRTGQANNDVNPVQTMGQLPEGVAMLSRITSTTAWWIETESRQGLKVMKRRGLEKSMEGDFDTDSMRYKTTERYQTGWDYWNCAYGTPGL